MGDGGPRDQSRRNVLVAAAWSVPAVGVALAVPLASASGGSSASTLRLLWDGPSWNPVTGVGEFNIDSDGPLDPTELPVADFGPYAGSFVLEQQRFDVYSEGGPDIPFWTNGVRWTGSGPAPFTFTIVVQVGASNPLQITFDAPV